MRLSELKYITRLTDQLYAVAGPNTSRFPFSSGFLIVDDAVALIDSGIGEERIREIDRDKRIDILIISHTHPDHILHWHVLKDRHILLPKETPDSVFDLVSLGERFTGSPDKGAYWAKVIGNGLGIQPLRVPDARFGDGVVLKFGQSRIKALHTPGHLADHYCFFDETNKVLLTTDIDFTSFGPWYGNPEGDIHQFRESVKKMGTLKTECVCSSHKPPVWGAQEIEDAFLQYLALFERQKMDVYEICHTPRTITQLVSLSPFYRNRFRDKVLQRIFEEPMIKKNLDILIREGKIRETFGTYVHSGTRE